MTEPYYYVRFKWFKRADMGGAKRELEESFQVTSLRAHRGGRDIDLSPFEREELRVRADTLAAYLSPFRAVLFQREATPFTRRDLELRDVLFRIYPRDVPSPLPMFYMDEPKFEVADELSEVHAKA